VVAAHTVAGDADAVVRVRVEGIEELERTIEQLRRDPKVMRTRTMVALSTLVERP
jgi:DNA-binding Lrp family transcriptional regulator